MLCEAGSGERRGGCGDNISTDWFILARLGIDCSPASVRSGMVAEWVWPPPALRERSVEWIGVTGTDCGISGVPPLDRDPSLQMLGWCVCEVRSVKLGE